MTSRTKLLLLLLALFAATFVVYFQTVSFEFVYDDNAQLVANEWIRSVGHLPEILTSSVWEHMDGRPTTNTYRPVMYLVYMAEYQLFGLKPWGYHLVNVLFHFLNSALVFFLASELIKDRSAGGVGVDQAAQEPAQGGPWPLYPFIAALLFALHPINTEVVSWVAAVPELTATLFSLASIYLYIRADRDASGAISCLIFSILLFFLAMVSKETGVMTLLMLPAYELSVRGIRGVNARRVKRYLPYVGVFIVYMVIRTLVIGGITNVQNVTLTPWEAVINVPPLVARYAGHLFFPVGLKAIYPFIPVSSPFEPLALVGLVMLLAYGALVYLARRRSALVFSLLWVAVPLLPVLYVPAVSVGGFADRYLYMSSIGFSMAAVFGLGAVLRGASGGIRARQRPTSAVICVIFGLVAVLYGAGAALRSRVWQNDLTLWTDTAKGYPEKADRSDMVHYNLAWALHKAGDLDAAAVEYERALKANPDKEKAHFNLAVILDSKGQAREAAEHYTRTLELNPGNVPALYNLATLKASSGETALAIRLFNELLRQNPGHRDARFNLAVTYGLIKEHELSITHYSELIRRGPASADAYLNLGLQYRALGLEAKAREAFTRALKIDPGLEAARRALSGL